MSTRDANAENEKLREGIFNVSHGAKVKVGDSPGDYVKNASGGIMKEAPALVYALTDLDSWYSIIMSSGVAWVLNRNNYFFKVAGSTFFREFLTFTLYELLQPKLSSVIPRFGVHDIDTQRYAAGPIKPETNPRLHYAAQETLVSNAFDWELTFKEWANALPIIIVAMVIVDVGLGKRSDLRSLLHYMTVMLVVSATRYVKNSVLVNNPARQTSTEIFRRAMALGHSFEVVPNLETGKLYKLPARVVKPGEGPKFK